MSETPRLLVVDDEDVLCQVCRRVFSDQGLEVDVSTDARDGLAWAQTREYGAVLLDARMPVMDGIQFLRSLRQTKPELPVLLMTAYPSVSNAAAAVRLGISDYLVKPFSAEELTQAVRRVIALPERETRQATTQPPELADQTGWEAETLFWDEAWFRLESDGSACVGAVVPGLRGAAVKAVRLPRVGELALRGLPLAGIALEDGTSVRIPSPISGVVAGVNDALAQDPSLLLRDPCGEGWIACVCTTRMENEAGACRPRRVILVNAEDRRAEEQQAALTRLGCRVRRVGRPEGLAEALRDRQWPVAILDGCSLGERGPEMVGILNGLAPSVRVVVVAASNDEAEIAYRKHRILYYAVEPFADDEIADILDAAFRVHEHVPGKTDRGKTPSEPVSSIAITGRGGRKVRLLAAAGLLRRDEGLGGHIARKLQERALAPVVAAGEGSIQPADLRRAAATCERLIVLSVKDSGLLPGGLVREGHSGPEVLPAELAGKTTVLAVQPDGVGGLGGLDPRTTAALAEHIVWEMARSSEIVEVEGKTNS